MYKRILVAVDESETSKLALNEAITLAKNQHATLRFVHVVDLTTFTDVKAPYAHALRAAGQKLIDSYSSLARVAEIDFDARMLVVEALGQHIYDAIEEEANRWPADLIVIGTHGRRGIRRLLLGSVAEGVTRVSTKPVLLIRGT